MQPRPHTRSWLIAIAAAAGLTACGGSDDTPTPVDPPVTASNLADCHNPSMYTLGSSWSVTFNVSGTDLQPGQAPAQTTWESTDNTWVLKPPAAWTLPDGTVRLSYVEPAPSGSYPNDLAGTYVRLHENTVETIVRAGWVHSSVGLPYIFYSAYTPGLAEPIALGSGQTYQSPPVSVYTSSSSALFDADFRPYYPNPPLGDEAQLQPDKATQQLTYVGRETITVPAGTFATCHIQRPEGPDEWRLAEGPYKGITIKTWYSRVSGTVLREAKQISAIWK